MRREIRIKAREIKKGDLILDPCEDVSPDYIEVYKVEVDEEKDWVRWCAGAVRSSNKGDADMRVIRFMKDEREGVVIEDNLLTEEQEEAAPHYALMRRVQALRDYIENDQQVVFTKKHPDSEYWRLFDALEEAESELAEFAIEEASKIIGEYKSNNRKPPKPLAEDVNRMCDFLAPDPQTY